MIKCKTKFIKETNNNSIKLVYELSDIEDIDKVELPMVTSNNIKGLLETTYCSFDSNRYIKYNISSKISLYKYLRTNINKKKLLTLLLSIINTLLNIDDYLIIENHMMYDIEKIYVDVSTLETFMMCLPIKQDKDISIKLLIKDIIMNCKFEKSDNTEYVLTILNSLNSDEDFVLSEFKLLIENLNNDYSLSKNSNLYNDDFTNNNELEEDIKVVVNDNENGLIYDESIDMQTNNYLDKEICDNEKKRKSERKLDKDISITKNIKQTLHDVKSEFNKFKFNISKKEIKQYDVNKDDLELEVKSNNFEFAIPNIGNKKNNKNKTNKKEKLNDRKKRSKKEKLNTQKKKIDKKNVSSNSFLLHKDKKKNNSNSESSPNLFEKYENDKINLKENHNHMNHIRKIHPNDDDKNIDYNLVNRNLIDDKNDSSIYNNNYDNCNTVKRVSMETIILGDVNNRCLDTNNFPYIIRKKTNDKIFINKNLFKIGKEKTYVDYDISDNNTISRTHADIIKDGDKYFIQDNNSKNHTYVNHSKIGQDKELLIHDCIITLSNEEFVFKMY